LDRRKEGGIGTMARILAIAMLAAAAFAQTPSPGDAVLTIHGVCSFSPTPLAAGAQDCTVVVRRQQLDDLLKIVAPSGQVTAAVKRNLATTYTDLLAFEMAAKKSGLANSSQFQESLEWLRLRTLADQYRRGLEKELSAASDQEIDDYYRQHIAQFEEVKLRRMLLPKTNFAAADKEASEKKALEIASEFGERAAKGDDLDQLQKEVYAAAGLNTLPPTTEVGNRRRTGLPPEVSEDVFALHPGEVTKVEKEAYSFVIYKVDSKRTLPKERVREEISREIVKQKLDAALKSITGSVHADLNENYFGPAPEQ
jgi:parvulin-like peptidyl-prolyl isomerase